MTARNGSSVSIMNYNEASARLIAHASKTEHAGETGGPCFGVELYLVERGTGSIAQLRVSFRDVLDCLEVVNRAVNGDVPSETFAKARPLDAELVYSVAEILHEGWELVVFETPSEPAASEMFLIFWAISHAWVSVLAGDIDSLRDEIRFEAQARGFELDLVPLE